MKLNNRGWGIQAMMVMTLILMLCLILVAAMIQRNFGTIFKNDPTTTDKGNAGSGTKPDKKQTYSDLEEQVVTASKEYQKTNYNDMLDGERITVTLKMLNSKGLLSNVYDIKDNKIECSGYGLFYKKNDNITYQAYLKCGENYTTDGYNEIYDL